MDNRNSAPPGIHIFFMEAHQISIEAQFIIDSLPNAEYAAVERICLQLHAIRRVLVHLNDPYTSEEQYIRKGTLETFRQIFFHLEESHLLDLNDRIHRACLVLVFLPRIQDSLNRMMDAWNHHKIRTAGNRTPIAIFELSREQALTGGYWTGDPGDPINVAADPLYGVDTSVPPLPDDNTDETEVHADEEDVEEAREVLEEMNIDLNAEDGRWGIDVYSEAVMRLKAHAALG
ncbi:hypothetical protein BV25DRAFT_1808530 [Artomyces pyxidatus]|uniref:Uncharacterized protein n=1 Tax=Artomyces pyxidatus TaxID=48021 RepID=A0ACB8STC5_9AGAM|nr:hypothetical protein BV25DRAFT_1808530 [Artomyces pyxidatus]